MNIPYWHKNAPCQEVGVEIFFPEDGENPTDARRICRACPYKAPCAIGAAQRGERYGVWGGYTTRQLRTLRRELDLPPLKTGRPRTNPVRLSKGPAMARALDETLSEDAA